MTRYTLIVLVAAFGMCQAVALANCPYGATDEIFCDDFDTYCLGGGHPMGGTKCPTDGSAVRHDVTLKQTWLRWPPPIGDPGTEMLVEDNESHCTSPPYGGHHPCQGDARIGQMTIRDWEHSAAINGPESGQIRNMIWLLDDTFGNGVAAVVGTDANPLVMKFLLNAATSDKIAQNNGYIELTLGEDKAQTDYVLHENCDTYCSPPIALEEQHIICAQGNPDGTLPAGCPSPSTAPVHASIAVGVLGMMDTDPCHCGVTQHGSTNHHLVVYDGQNWWQLRNENPYTTGGTVVPKDDAPMPPPGDIAEPGDFTLNGGCSVPGAKSHNYITLTIKTNTFDVQLVTFQSSCSDTSKKYWVSSTMTLPRVYEGNFDSIRIGVSTGCPLASSASWSTCGNANGRVTHRTRVPSAGANTYDDFVVYGGEGETVNGACCDPSSGTCTDDVDPGDCTSPKTFFGANTSCSTELCCVDPFADNDHDGDVDQADFGAWQACFAGSGEDYPAGCECFDRHPATPDGDIDGDDFTAFMNCWSGPSVAVNPACDD